jgi:bifunctional NMN adenylyltransferase/nudix hydrolase
VGHRKDATSEYLSDFPGWLLDDVGSQGDMHSSTLRDAFFGAAGQPLEPALAALVSQAPPSTLGFLRAWAQLPCYRELAAEWASLRSERALWARAPYPPVFVTVDALIECAGHVLLIVRGRAPGKGLYALPGGFLEQRETVYQSALRELQEETGLHLLPGDIAHALKGVRVFDHPDRSQRGRVITHAHHFDLGARRLPEVSGSDDALSAAWAPIGELAAMEDRFHDDHFHILDSFLGLTA